jgi:hypothetical protein
VEIWRRWVQGTYTAYSCEVYVPPFPTAYFRSKFQDHERLL